MAAELARAGYDASRRRAVAREAGYPGNRRRGPGRGCSPADALHPRSLGVSARFDPTLVRGLGYYTGQIFEISHPDVPYSLGGGGRYDGMTARFGAPALPMCGFSIGFERICDMVDREIFGSGGTKMAVTCATEEELLRCLATARTRRENDPLLRYAMLSGGRAMPVSSKMI